MASLRPNAGKPTVSNGTPVQHGRTSRAFRWAALGATAGAAAGVAASFSPATLPAHAKVAGSSSERLARWTEGWKVGRTAFHRNVVAPTLVENERSFLSPKESNLRVLVPLCGKTVDMPWLAQMERVAQVVGVEGVPKAVAQFNNENKWLQMRRKLTLLPSTFTAFHGKKTTMLQGDFFLLDAAAAGGPVDRVWDRGSLVAIDPSLRESYVQVMDSVLKPGGMILLEGLDRKRGPEPGRKKGPPFSVTGKDVRRLFDSKRFVVKKLSSFNILKGKGSKAYDRFTSEGLTVMNQEAWLITKRK